jgi:hypothetical protein
MTAPARTRHTPPAPLRWGIIEWAPCGCTYRLIGLFPTRAQAAALAAQHAGAAILFRPAPATLDF